MAELKTLFLLVNISSVRKGLLRALGRIVSVLLPAQARVVGSAGNASGVAVGTTICLLVECKASFTGEKLGLVLW